ncbi:MAG: NACHT domain-containing protein [Acidobacteria bacterium]|nr:NACHT domain-containing protein [Acidobacteriota bacterium]
MDFNKIFTPGSLALIVVTALVSLLMGVFGKAAAEWLLNLILRPVRSLKEYLYSWIAPRNPFSISLHSYRRHVSRSNLTRIENPVGPNLEVPLERAFAPLRLISGATEESVDLYAQAAASHRCIVLGGPGTGKTTLMKSLVTSVVRGRGREEALRDLIPVFVVLRNLAKREHTVVEAIVAAFAGYHFPGAAKFVESALEQGKLLIVLDGLDEVGANRAFVAEQIREFCEYDDQRAHPNRLFVTCREHSYRTRDLQGVIPEVVRVEPFANHHMRVFLQGWPAHKGRAASKLYGLIQSDPQIRDICRNPLLLTILTGLYLDTDTFELPSSRERFYSDAVDELLVHRPARRNVEQTFKADDKRQILERVALDRLETAERHEDPEEFTHEVIREKASEVLHQDKFDPRELIKELVEVNGIIRPADEDNYTCAHRTIQEYFAAREAKHKRKNEEVVEHFGARPEFIEVLYFYCGLLDNLPSLAYVVNTLISQQRWLEAGRCLLYMREPPAASFVERVAHELHGLVSPKVEFKSALEVLSSLAQRRAPEFDPARELFAQAIDRLTEGYGENGASALESALATSPEAAMKVIPGLLKHPSPRWREAAVQLLRDIGTDEALDQLVLLLTDPDSTVRGHAGLTLTGMLKSRPHDLRARAALLPQRTNATVWPLEEYFPGRLAIPIAESLVEDHYSNSVGINNKAIILAVMALRARAEGKAFAERDLKFWRRVPRDLLIRRYTRRAGRAFALCGYGLVLGFFLAVAALLMWGDWTDRMLAITPTSIRTVENVQLLHVRELARLVINDIIQRYSPNYSGYRPNLMDEKYSVYWEVGAWANINISDPYKLPPPLTKIDQLREITSGEKLEELDTRIRLLNRQLTRLKDEKCVLVKPRVMTGLNFIFALITAFLIPFAVIPFFRTHSPGTADGKRTTPRRESWTKHARAQFGLLGHFEDYAGRNLNLLFIILLVVPSTLLLYGSFGSTAPSLVVVPGPLVVGAGWLLQKLDWWPSNPILAVVDDVTPLPKNKRARE